MASPPVTWTHEPSDQYDRWLRARLWHAMTLGDFGRLLKGRSAGIAVAKYPLVLTIAATALLNSTAASLEAIVRRSAGRHTTVPSKPVVIIGFWRSGTTLLHGLMARDPQFVAPTTLQCLFPQSFRAARALSFLIRPLLPAVRPMDAVSLAPGSPQEDELAILNMGLPTPIQAFAFPSLFGAGPVDAGVSDDWLQRWSAFLSAVQVDDPVARLLLKAPGHTMRIAEIRLRFPDAVFVHLTRQPDEQIASAVKMFHAMAQTQSLEARLPPLETIAEFVLATHEAMYERFFETAASLTDHELVHLRYEDLVADPDAAIGRLCQQLGIAPGPARETSVDAESGPAHSVDRYALSPAFCEEISRRTARYRAAFGYP